MSYNVPDRQFIDAIVAQWKNSPHGLTLRHKDFPEAIPTECHANAARYATEHGGTVIHGFLVHPSGSWQVHVIAHSVVRLKKGDLVDPTLKDDARQGYAYFEYDGDAALFLRHTETKEWADVPVEIGETPIDLMQHIQGAPDDNPKF